MLKCDFGRLNDEIARLEQSGAQLLHWDVMDGHFVPNLSYGALVLERIRRSTNLFFDAHLMISDPGRYLDDYLRAGCDAITFHIEAVPDAGPLLERIRAAGVFAGLAVNPHTPMAAIEPHLAGCDVVLVMSVQPGFGGQKFMPEVLPKVRAIHDHRHRPRWLSIDGGIGPETIAAAAAAGVDWFVAGSSVFDQSDYRRAMEQMLEASAGARAGCSGSVAAQGSVSPSAVR
jgi:ribulose-phosphate 3-epimerase